MVNLEAVENFNDAIKEIKLLLDYSKRNQKDLHKYATFNKAALVLLCAKFESFIENFLEEYAYEHIRNSNNVTLLREIYEHIVDNILDNIASTQNNLTKRKNHIKELVILCNEVTISTLEDFKVNPKFRGGKHGQKEVERLLKKFGFAQLLEEDIMQNFFNKFNSLNSIRNNIVHEDATPSLTHKDVQEYLSIIQKFVERIHIEADLILLDMNIIPQNN